jgi:peptide-methionine (S)-S-oxide reductase
MGAGTELPAAGFDEYSHPTTGDVHMRFVHMRAGIAFFVFSTAAMSLAACVDARGQSAGPAPAPQIDAPITSVSARDTAVFAGGCFWGLEGVESVVSGYTGGSVVRPSYEQVSTGKSGHAESVRIVYDPSRTSYGRLLRVFFSVATDPTQLDRQGPDVGPQYRSAIFFANADQKRIAEAYIAQLEAAHTFPRPIVTQVVRLGDFYPAEAYHQDYMAHHPDALYIVINDAPKVEALRREFPEIYRK